MDLSICHKYIAADQMPGGVCMIKRLEARTKHDFLNHTKPDFNIPQLYVSPSAKQIKPTKLFI